MTFFLIMDTAGEKGIAALFKDQTLLAEVLLPNTLEASKILLPEIIALFEKAKITPKDLAFVATGIGPGSYTGIRIAVMTAKSFAYSLKIPLVGVVSLESYVPQENGSFAVLADARMGGVYAMKGEGDNREPPILIKLEELPGFLQDVKIQVDTRKVLPSARAFGKAALQKFRQKEYTINGPFPLLYLRKTQAEIEKEKTNNLTG